MRIIFRILIVALVVFSLPTLVPGIDVSGFYAALVVAILLGIINITLKPLLFILTLPVTILTLGLFSFVINAILLKFVATIVKGFEINGFIPALLGSLIISLVGSIVGMLLKK